MSQSRPMNMEVSSSEYISQCNNTTFPALTSFGPKDKFQIKKIVRTNFMISKYNL